MTALDDSSHPFPRLLTARYRAALALIGLLLFIGFVFTQFAVFRHGSDTQVMDVAVQQRILSQQLAKAALMVQYAADSSAKAAAQAELGETAHLLQRSAEGLLRGNNSPAVQRLFSAIDSAYQSMISAATCIADSTDAIHPTEACDPNLPAQVDRVLNAEQTFLKGMDAVADQYLVEFRAVFDAIGLFQVILLLIMLGTLFIIGHFVFRPVIERLQRDLSELLHVQAALRESRQFAEHVTEFNPNIIYIYDIEEQRNVYSNREIAAILGYTPAEIKAMGRDLSSTILHPDERKQFLEHGQRIAAAKDGDVIDFEYRARHKNGEWRWLYSRKTVFLRTSEGKVKQYLGNAQDVTERKRAEETLQLTQFSVDRARDLILWIGKDGRFLNVNHSVSQSLGYTRAELLEMNIQDVLPILADGSWAMQWDAIRKAGAFNSEVRIIGKEGSKIPAEVSADFLKFGEDEYIVAFVRNISERKQAEKALLKAKEAAEAANRAKSTFLANMSHELRTPLNAILGFAQLLGQDQTLNHDQRSYIETILRSGEHLLGLINDVLEMSKIESGQAVLHEENFDLHRMLDTVSEMLHVRARAKGLVLLFDHDPRMPQHVRGDERKLRQVLINLVGNALKFTQEGGVNVRVQCKRLNDQNANTAQLMFEVEDTGVGMAPEELDKLFQLFVQTESGQSAVEGTGLGLVISREFVRLMGGDMTVTSKRGDGTLVNFDVRVCLSDTADVQPIEQERRVVGLEPGQRTFRILVVEDKLENRLLLTRLMQSIGFDVREAVNGWEAVQVWEHWKPDLIWMDMRMPVMSGYEATERIRQHPQGKAVVIIALTASAFDHERAAILSMGCNDTVPKPFQAMMLFDRLTAHLGVRFRYADLNTRPQLQVTTATTQLSTTVSASSIAALKKAAVELDSAMAQDVIDKLQSEDPALANALGEMVRNFRFDKMLEMLQQIEEQTNA